MNTVIIFAGIRIRWKIKPGLTAKYMLKSIPGFYFLNPLEFISTYNLHKLIDIELDHMYKGEGYISTTGILLVRKKGNVKTIAELWDEIPEFFKYIKSYSLQFDLLYKFFHAFADQPAQLKKSNVLPNNLDEFALHEHRHLTNLSWLDFIKADAAKARGVQIPVHREIFLDGVGAHFDYDYRRSILYFCMACETKISEVLLNEYHFKKGRVKKGITSGSDPVYELLLKEKWHFKFKLHEHFYYLFNTSIKLKNSTLYDSLIKLYNTRNKIVHEGEVKIPQNSLLTVDEKGSNTAFDITIEFMAWLGENDFHVFKNRKLIHLK